MGKILIVGGTGMAGSAITRALSKAGMECRVFARREPQALPSGATFVRGDVANAEALASAALGCEQAVISLAGRAAEFDRIEHRGSAAVVAAMGRVGGRRVVLLSGSSTGVASPWFESGQAKQKAESAVLNAPLEGVVLRPSWFMETLDRMVRNGSISYFGGQPHPIHWLSLDDLGAAVVRALTSGETAGKTLPIYGPEGVTFGAAAAAYAKAMGLARGVRPMPLWIGKLIATFSKDIRPFVQLMRVFESFREDADLSLSHSLLGRPTTTLDEWLRRRGAAPSG
jgi:nucleoside-diphosphate-sugar epimerase